MAEDGYDLHAAGHAGAAACPDPRTRAGPLRLSRRHAPAFKRRVDEGRARLTLIANEVARLASTILLEYAVAVRKIKDSRNAPDAAAMCAAATAAPGAA